MAPVDRGCIGWVRYKEYDQFVAVVSLYIKLHKTLNVANTSIKTYTHMHFLLAKCWARGYNWIIASRHTSWNSNQLHSNTAMRTYMQWRVSWEWFKTVVTRATELSFSCKTCVTWDVLISHNSHEDIYSCSVIMFLHTHVHMHAHMHVHMPAHTHVHMHAHTHTRTQVVLNASVTHLAATPKCGHLDIL